MGKLNENKNVSIWHEIMSYLTRKQMWERVANGYKRKTSTIFGKISSCDREYSWILHKMLINC